MYKCEIFLIYQSLSNVSILMIKVMDFNITSLTSLVCFTAWHEVDDSKPRFQGRLNVIDDLFSRVWQSHEEFSPVRPVLTHRPRSNTFGNETG